MKLWVASIMTKEDYAEMMNGGYHFSTRYWKIHARTRNDAEQIALDKCGNDIVYTVTEYLEGYYNICDVYDTTITVV